MLNWHLQSDSNSRWCRSIMLSLENVNTFHFSFMNFRREIFNTSAPFLYYTWFARNMYVLILESICVLTVLRNIWVLVKIYFHVYCFLYQISVLYSFWFKFTVIMLSSVCWQIFFFSGKKKKESIEFSFLTDGL